MKRPWRDIADGDWRLWVDENRSPTVETIGVAASLGIYSELKRLNALLHCSNFVRIPGILRVIEINTRKPKKKAKTA
jgi:hypothetical protein